MADNLEVINCPACGNSMAKVYIKSANIHIDVCLEGCGGIFFDNREFEKFDEAHEDFDEILTFYDEDERKFHQIDDNQVRTCSACGSVMCKIGNGTPDKSFKIDCCYNCGAKFLDAYELQKIRNVCNSEKLRTDAFNKEFMSIYGEEIDSLNARCEQIKPDKNIMRKVLQKIFTTTASRDNQNIFERFTDIIGKNI